jgi:hypothetical protein
VNGDGEEHTNTKGSQRGMGIVKEQWHRSDEDASRTTMVQSGRRNHRHAGRSPWDMEGLAWPRSIAKMESTRVYRGYLAREQRWICLERQGSDNFGLWSA